MSSFRHVLYLKKSDTARDLSSLAEGVPRNACTIKFPDTPGRPRLARTDLGFAGIAALSAALIHPTSSEQDLLVERAGDRQRDRFEPFKRDRELVEGRWERGVRVVGERRPLARPSSDLGSLLGGTPLPPPIRTPPPTAGRRRDEALPVGTALQKLSLRVLAAVAGAPHDLSPAVDGGSLDLYAPVERVGPRDQVEGGPLRG